MAKTLTLDHEQAKEALNRFLKSTEDKQDEEASLFDAIGEALLPDMHALIHAAFGVGFAVGIASALQDEELRFEAPKKPPNEVAPTE